GGAGSCARPYYAARDERVDLLAGVADLLQHLAGVLTEERRRRVVCETLAVEPQRRQHRLDPADLREHAARACLRVLPDLDEVLHRRDRDAREPLEPVRTARPAAAP